MADPENRQNVNSVRRECGTENVPCSGQSVHARPRLGQPRDSWTTVLKDMLREAPRTGLVIFTMLVLAIINAVTYLCALLAGSSAAPPLGGARIRWLFDAALELLIR